MKNDIRWIQRFDSYTKALSDLREAVELSEERELSKLEEQGMIKAFEFTQELSWKCMKDFLEERGNNEIYGSKDAVRAAFLLGIIENGQIWMDMIKSRNNSAHIYNRTTAKELFHLIVEQYFFEFEKLYDTLSEFKSKLYEHE